ncbi:GntR family transcriptional regulator [Streptomyces sp. LP05-1]|uniref:GntR family transcriptional regulator n=1 Tax=Streptomyces pyxinae TaxID=2970734 RepID=A0ABT2CMM6_9ACTN|nr:GntR family transcriptional regulator [Streptomyces sp. LP05-1]MCS0638664.1 GntR family transcriptional regulator [Streptomyces sp. LP05-1]
MPASGAVTRSTLRQQIADALRDEVLAGRLRPGEEFTVKQIADQYGVSTTPVREALVDLCAQGLLDSDQHRGFRVHEFSVADYRGMVEARALVVEGVLRALPVRSGRFDGYIGAQGTRLLSVRRRAEEASRAARGGDLDILIGYDLRFWRELGGLITNRYIAEFLQRLRVQSWVFAVPHLRVDRNPCAWLWNGYEELVGAVTLADPGALAAALDAHNQQALAWADHLENRPR